MRDDSDIGFMESRERKREKEGGGGGEREKYGLSSRGARRI